MELEDLKTAWKAVEPHIGGVSQKDNFRVKEHSGVKSRLIRRMALAALTTFIGFALTATSWLWAPVKLELPLLIAFCVIILTGCLAELYLVRSISRINLWHDTNAEVFNAVWKIKKTYRQMELWLSASIILTIGWATMTPPFVNTVRAVIVWIMLAIALALEYVWYRKTIKTLNELTDSN